tara:strand:- start:509 stop:1162 length:654 start_codon:yes stop_codon:yes gene_type:complete
MGVGLEAQALVSHRTLNKLLYNAFRLKDFQTIEDVINEGFDYRLFYRYLVEKYDVRNFLPRWDDYKHDISTFHFGLFDGHCRYFLNEDEDLIRFRDEEGKNWKEVTERMNYVHGCGDEDVYSVAELQDRYDQLKSDFHLPHVIHTQGMVVCVTEDGFFAFKQAIRDLVWVKRRSLFLTRPHHDQNHCPLTPLGRLITATPGSENDLFQIKKMITSYI